MSSSSPPSPREQRRHRRIDASLPVRFTEDGKRFEDGVVTSFGGGGVFIQSDASPRLRSILWLDFGLGDTGRRVRIEGKVVNFDRRIGTEVIRGFGLRFEEAPREMEARIASFERRSPGHVQLHGDGRLRWPVPHGDGRERAMGSGLRLWSGGRWNRERGTADLDSGAVGRSTAEYVSMLRGLRSTLAGGGLPRVILAYRGHALAPRDGVPRTELLADLDGSGSRWGLLFATQMRLVDDIGAAGWRLEGMRPEQVEALRQIPVQLAELRRVLEPTASGQSADAPPAQALAGLAALERFTERLLFSAETLAPPEATRRAYEIWQKEKRTRTRRARAEEASGAASPAARSRGPGAPARVHLVILALVACIAFAVGHGVFRSRQVLAQSKTPVQTLTLELLSERVPVDGFHLEDGVVVLSVPFEWGELPADRLHVDFSALCTELSVRGHREAVAQTPDGTLVALWRGGKIQIMR